MATKTKNNKALTTTTHKILWQSLDDHQAEMIAAGRGEGQVGRIDIRDLPEALQYGR